MNQNNEYVGKSLTELKAIRSQLTAEYHTLAETSEDHDYYATLFRMLTYAEGIAIATRNFQ